MAILTATDALYMTLYKRCPSYLNEAEEAIKEAIKNGKTDAQVTLSYMPSVFKESLNEGSGELLQICYDNTAGVSDFSGDQISLLASSLEHPKLEDWLFIGDLEHLKKALESYTFKFMKAKALLASYLVKLGYKVTSDLDEFIDTNNLTISWV